MFKARAHYCGLLLGEPRLKIEKEAGLPSATTRSKLLDIKLNEVYGVKKSITSKYLEKGLFMEDKSIDMLSDLDGEFYMKNEEERENDYLTGTCDIVTDDSIIDVKTSWDIFTFSHADLTPLYEAQLRAYMELWDKDKAELVYCLHDATEDMIEKEIWKIRRNYEELDEDFESEEDMMAAFQSEVDQIRTNLILGDKMPMEKRVKRFVVYRDVEKTKELYRAIERARAYYNSINV